MSQPAKLQEPTMEEILASIRRIIAEDDLRPPPSPPPPPPVTQAPETAPIPATVEAAPRDEVVEGFDDPQVSNVAANDVFDQRESPWRPGEEVAADETPEPTAPDVHLDAPKPVVSLDHPRFAAAQSEPVPGPARDLSSREPAQPPRLEPFRSESAKAELGKLEVARSDFARAEAFKSDLARSEHARRDPAKPQPPRLELPRRDAARWESPRPESEEPVRAEPAKPPAVASTSALRAAEEEGLLSPRTTAAVDIAFNTLAQTVLVQNSRTLEDLVREMLKPMLKAWLDDNLPSVVERLVRAEIERAARGRG